MGIWRIEAKIETDLQLDDPEYKKFIDHVTAEFKKRFLIKEGKGDGKPGGGAKHADQQGRL